MSASTYVDTATGMVLSRIGNLSGSGYERVLLDGRDVGVHRIVWEALHGPIPDGLTINHLDGDKTNNHPDNLALATMSEQHLHAYATGLRAVGGGAGRQGEAHPQARLTEDAVRDIRAATGVSQRKLAELHGVTQSTVYRIRKGLAWAHVS